MRGGRNAEEEGKRGAKMRETLEGGGADRRGRWGRSKERKGDRSREEGERRQGRREGRGERKQRGGDRRSK